MSYENRKFTRVQALCNAYVTSESGESVDGTLANISLGGLILECQKTLPEDTECTVRLAVSPATEIEVRGSVIRVEDGTMAIVFKTIMSTGFLDLHELLREHSDDPDIIDTEVQERRHLMPDIE